MDMGNIASLAETRLGFTYSLFAQGESTGHPFALPYNVDQEYDSPELNSFL